MGLLGGGHSRFWGCYISELVMGWKTAVLKIIWYNFPPSFLIIYNIALPTSGTRFVLGVWGYKTLPSPSLMAGSFLTR